MWVWMWICIDIVGTNAQQRVEAEDMERATTEHEGEQCSSYGTRELKEEGIPESHTKHGSDSLLDMLHEIKCSIF